MWFLVGSSLFYMRRKKRLASDAEKVIILSLVQHARMHFTENAWFLA
jgi:hypothetical protein